MNTASLPLSDSLAMAQKPAADIMTDRRPKTGDDNQPRASFGIFQAGFERPGEQLIIEHLTTGSRADLSITLPSGVEITIADADRTIA